MSLGAVAAGAVITTELTSAGWRLKNEKTISWGKFVAPGFQELSTRPSMRRLPLNPGPNSEVTLSMIPPISEATMSFFCCTNGGTTSATGGGAGAGAGAEGAGAGGVSFELADGELCQK